LAVECAKITIGESTEILADMGVRISFSQWFIGVNFETILTSIWQLYGDKHLQRKGKIIQFQLQSILSSSGLALLRTPQYNAANYKELHWVLKYLSVSRH
jgi:hypothetical protein